MKPNSIHQTFGIHPPNHRVWTPSKVGIFIPLLFVTAREMKSLEAVDSLFSGKRYFSSPLNRLVGAFLSVSFSLVLGVMLKAFLGTVLSVPNGALYDAALFVPAQCGIIVALYLRFSAMTVRYLMALDLLSNGDIDNLDYRTVNDVCDHVNRMIGHSTGQIQSIKLTLPESGIQGQNELAEQIGQLIPIVRTFQGINGIDTGIAGTILREEGVNI